MGKMKPAMPIRPLPGRGALNDLGKSQRTILDYAKAVPSMPSTAGSPSILMLASKMPK